MLLVAPKLAYPGKLTILTWQGHFSQAIVDQWQQESGHRIELIYYDNEEKRDRIIASQPMQIDIAVIDTSNTQTFGNGGFLAEIDPQQHTNEKHLYAAHRQACTRYGSPFNWGVIGIAYRADKLPSPPTSWRDLLIPSEALQGHVGMLEDYYDTLIPPLILHGYAINTDNPLQLQHAFQTLKRQMPAVLTYKHPLSFIQNDPKAESLYMAMAYSGETDLFNREYDNANTWRFSIPDEGSALWIDCLAILQHSKQKAIAASFINYLQQPSIAARNSLDTQIATANRTALSRFDEQELQTINLPNADTIAKSQRYTPLSAENILLRNRITNSLLKMHDSQ